MFQTSRDDAECCGKGKRSLLHLHHHDHDEQGDPVSHPLATLEGEVNRDEERLDDLQVGYKETIAIIVIDFKCDEERPISQLL